MRAKVKNLNKNRVSCQPYSDSGWESGAEAVQETLTQTLTIYVHSWLKSISIIYFYFISFYLLFVIDKYRWLRTINTVYTIWNQIGYTKVLYIIHKQNYCIKTDLHYMISIYYFHYIWKTSWIELQSPSKRK